MRAELESLVEHDQDQDCPACQAQNLAGYILLPAVATWEQANDLPRFSMALHGAAALLGYMIQEGVERNEIETALGRLLDDIEAKIIAEGVLGGPVQGSA